MGLETCDKVRRLFLFPISKENKNLGFSHVKSGNPDTSRYFVLSGRSAVVSDYAANFSQTKKIVNLPGSGFFFFHGGKKKKSGIPEKSGGGPSLDKDFNEIQSLPRFSYRCNPIPPPTVQNT